MLESQPQKSEVAKRSAGRPLRPARPARRRPRAAEERQRGAARRRRRASRALQERLPGTIARPAPGDGNGKPPRGPRLPGRIGLRRPGKPQPGRYKRLRIAIVLVGLGALAMVSTVFGMMMSIAGDIPQFEDEAQYRASQNSEVFDAEGRKIGTLLTNTQRRLIESEDISPYMKQAVVAIEDQRFYEHRGVDFQGIARAVVADVMPGGSTQGASTITQQFVKNALEAQGSSYRTSRSCARRPTPTTSSASGTRTRS